MIAGPSVHLSAKVIIPGCPPSWSNLRGHHMALHSQKAFWKDLTWKLGHSARNAAHWPPLERVPPAYRWVRFDLYRDRLLDPDNAVASIKPLLDGLKGVLVVDDSPRWCGLLAVEQHKVSLSAAERTLIEVFLVDPR